ncbi:UR2R protein, partial [Amia calva]|nr:UR2R protein [Amia calva]
NLSLPSPSPSLAPSPGLPSTLSFSLLLSLLCVCGIAGNLYTLWLLLHKHTHAHAHGSRTRKWVSVRLPRSPAPSLHLQVLSLALADLLYLSTAPFIVAASLSPHWLFGEPGCRVLLSLDLLTLHASIFTLTSMSLDRYRAVSRPLETSTSPGHGSLRLGLAWGLALVLSLPMMVTLHLEEADREGTGEGEEAGRLCVPAWDEQSSKAYLSVLFCTSILGPGLCIGCLYAALARLYWHSQSQASLRAYPVSRPRPKVVVLVLAIVLTFWVCFLPFWLWQLLPLYCPERLDTLTPATQVTVNRVLTALTYGNSAVNPFYYTLLTGRGRGRERR